jgi:hypothetical protein
VLNDSLIGINRVNHPQMPQLIKKAKAVLDAPRSRPYSG